jgi:hypothetical protein
VVGINTPNLSTALATNRLQLRSRLRLSDPVARGRGVPVLLDPRVRRQRYGQTFQASLPPYRMTSTNTDMDAFFETNAQ